MTKADALYQFFSGFGIPAYEENNVYALEEPPSFPYLTYEKRTGSFGETDIPISFSLWYRSAAWAAADAKAEEISAFIGRDGYSIPIDNGYVLFIRSDNFAQSMGDPSDDMIKRKYCNLIVRYYTSN
jgi:hypothetical protein